MRFSVLKLQELSNGNQGMAWKLFILELYFRVALEFLSMRKEFRRDITEHWM